ncbi:glycosyl/glycerophosphate transferase [Lactobacillus plantarum] [Lactiplantibacillus mudanjiangensis]|uniref:CDP-glycerol glycerophosphotransferase family protein n=1 Tax=Lactiplantibacillus mudanjiangensis TaxID=1296538 RepID=UPI0010151C84|nr:CDP-glycerol glycerophosphotransferase family protein [Lactiplantibacillus mudanjiangensis]VDG32746.1 glycosyl/glycerophosphate transferase [Lactobacillus plantarum] [Lactiplantibacillus mudanjiangensis]
MNRLKSKIIYKIKRNIKLKDNIKIFLMIIQFPVVLAAFISSKFYKKNIWLIGETGNDAKDNGLAFFSFLVKEHAEINTIYYISGQTAAADHVRNLGPTVETNSFRHKVAFMSAKYVLSTHDGYSIPFFGANWREFKLAYGWLVPEKKFVFLNHGVNKDDMVENTKYKRTKFDFYVTTTEDEYREMTSSKYGYPLNDVVKTGLARYDFLLANRVSSKKKYIVFMPTWRYYLADVDDEAFVQSTYYKTIYSFLHDPRLDTILHEKKLQLYFFPPHHEIQKRIHLFDLSGKTIQSINTEETKFSDVVTNCSMMITDYSSVIFDFAYLYKRTAYFQFDLNEYREGQYKQGYFDYDEDGFGPIYSEENDLVNEIERASLIDFRIEEKYKNRISKTFTWHDRKNCERLFNILIK